MLFCFRDLEAQMQGGMEASGEVRSSCCMSRKGWDVSGISGEVGDEELCAAEPICSV